jgi:hypothetical protein
MQTTSTAGEIEDNISIPTPVRQLIRGRGPLRRIVVGARGGTAAAIPGNATPSDRDTNSRDGIGTGLQEVTCKRVEVSRIQFSAFVYFLYMHRISFSFIQSLQSLSVYC